MLFHVLVFFQTNVNGPLVLFQATINLLKASKNPRFIPISSGAGSVTRSPPMELQTGAYGASKAALNYLTRKLHFEEDWLGE